MLYEEERRNSHSKSYLYSFYSFRLEHVEEMPMALDITKSP
jgi:hypothetical protein